MSYNSTHVVEASSSTEDEKSNGRPPSGRSSGRRYKVWIDLENSPHIPFFEPIIEELKKRN